MREVIVDAKSLVADVPGSLTLAQVEQALSRDALTLDLVRGVAPGEATVADWLADGAPGARDPWVDPVDHLVAGLDARLRDGMELRIRPGPRRAVGPDLVALFFGARGRFGTIERAHLRIHVLSARRASTHPFVHPRDPPLSAGETQLLDAIARELGDRAR
jgi:alkyldihydroxyacetonephosphate synthase